MNPQGYPIWNRVIEWTYGITNTTKDEVARFSSDKIDYNENNFWLNSIAILNIKKCNGESRSEVKILNEYAKYDKLEIIRQIEIINPKIIVCGNTGKILDEILFDRKIKKNVENENWYYIADISREKNIVLDFYHPAIQLNKLLSYYTITNIYQLALKELHGS